MEPAGGGKAGWPAVSSARDARESDGEGGEALAGLSPALKPWPACAGSASSPDSAAAWLVAARSAWVRASSSSRPARLDASSQAISRGDCRTWRRLPSAKAARRRRAGGRYSACSGQMARWAMPCRWRCRLICHWRSRSVGCGSRPASSCRLSTRAMPIQRAQGAPALSTLSPSSSLPPSMPSSCGSAACRKAAGRAAVSGRALRAARSVGLSLVGGRELA